MKTPVRFGLVGAGGVGAYHLNAIRALADEKLAEVVAIADPTVDRLAKEKAEAESKGIRWYLDYRDMLAKETSLDAVTIATPIPFHLEMAHACIKRGLFVNLEKPPVPLIQQLESLIAADTRQRVAVGFQIIVSRAVQELKNRITSGKIGDIRDIRACGCWPRMDSYYNRASWSGKMTLRGEPVFDGPATNALAHLVHNIMFLASPNPDEFDAPVGVRGEFYRARPIESYDAVCMGGKFRSGVNFSAAFTHATKESLPWKIEVHGSKGSALVSNDGALFEHANEKIECPESTLELLKKTYRQFVAFARGEQPRVSTHLRDTRGYVLATNGALLSSGGIHDIAGEWIRTYKNGDDTGFDVVGLHEAVTNCFRTGSLFSELGLPWAATSQKVSLENFTTLEFPVVKKKRVSHVAERR
jgi:predicted dehydrogenase